MVLNDTSDTRMARIRLVGWRPGANKVRADKAIKAHANIGLSQAKGFVDLCINGEESEIQLPSVAVARQLAKELDAYGFDLETCFASMGSHLK